jgi:hypothetical protein
VDDDDDEEEGEPKKKENRRRKKTKVNSQLGTTQLVSGLKLLSRNF